MRSGREKILSLTEMKKRAFRFPFVFKIHSKIIMGFTLIIELSVTHGNMIVYILILNGLPLELQEIVQGFF